MRNIPIWCGSAARYVAERAMSYVSTHCTVTYLLQLYALTVLGTSGGFKQTKMRCTSTSALTPRFAIPPTQRPLRRRAGPRKCRRKTAQNTTGELGNARAQARSPRRERRGVVPRGRGHARSQSVRPKPAEHVSESVFPPTWRYLRLPQGACGLADKAN